MTRRRFEIFTPKHGDAVFTTRFQFVARVVTRFVRTLDYDYPIPLMPEPCELAPLILFLTNPIYWCPDCAAGACPGLQIGQCYVEGCAHDCNQDENENPPECSICGSLVGCSCSVPGWINGQDEGTEPDEPEEYDARICPDCGHDYYHDAQGRCMYPVGSGEEARVCGWHPDVMGPVPCESRVETPESLERGRMCYEGRCPRCHGEGCAEYWLGFKKAEGEYLAALRSHDCKQAGCGPVCTAFEW